MSIICPSNHYSGQLFDEKLKSIIIIKKENYYEPIYRYTINKEIQTRFDLNEPKNKDIKQTLEMIKNVILNKCGSFPSMPKTYNFKQNITLFRLVFLLKGKNYDIINQVMNYNGKVIGIVIKSPTTELKGFIPCFPSSPILDLTDTYLWVDDESYIDTYKNTIEFLTMITNEYKSKENKIPSNPKFKIVEEIRKERLVIGILTETNQFIPLSTPYISEKNADDDNERQKIVIPSINGNNYFDNDKLMLTTTEEEKERVEYIKKIKTENNAYNDFRNKIRILINEFNNRNIRNEIKNIISTPEILYTKKLKIIHALLNELWKSKFGTDEITKEKEGIYFSKIADELIRYNRIKSFIFEPSSFLMLNEVKYNLTDNEIILTNSLLTQEYFEKLIPAPLNKYIKYNTYGTTKPIISQSYSNVGLI